MSICVPIALPIITSKANGKKRLKTLIILPSLKKLTKFTTTVGI